MHLGSCYQTRALIIFVLNKTSKLPQNLGYGRVSSLIVSSFNSAVKWQASQKRRNDHPRVQFLDHRQISLLRTHLFVSAPQTGGVAWLRRPQLSEHHPTCIGKPRLLPNATVVVHRFDSSCTSPQSSVICSYSPSASSRQQAGNVRS